MFSLFYFEIILLFSVEKDDNEEKKHDVIINIIINLISL